MAKFNFFESRRNSILQKGIIFEKLDVALDDFSGQRRHFPRLSENWNGSFWQSGMREEHSWKTWFSVWKPNSLRENLLDLRIRFFKFPNLIRIFVQIPKLLRMKIGLKLCWVNHVTIVVWGQFTWMCRAHFSGPLQGKCVKAFSKIVLYFFKCKYSWIYDSLCWIYSPVNFT